MSDAGKPRTSVRLAGGAQGFNWLPVFVAEEHGLFSARGLSVEYRKLGSVEKATAAVLAGEADLAITPPEGAVTNFVRGGDLRIVGANAVRLPMSLVARPGIRTIGELKGSRIGTSSLTEGTAIYTQVMLAAEGLRYPGDYEFVLAGIHTKRWEALQSGEIDAAPQPAPWNFLAEENGYNILGEVSAAIPEILFTAIIGKAPWLSANGGAVARFLGALVDAHRITNDPGQQAKTLPIFQRITTPESPSLARRGLDYMRALGMWPAGLAVPPEALKTTIDLMVAANLLNASSKEAAAGVVDESYLKEAA